jgi:hypothetical protein
MLRSLRLRLLPHLARQCRWQIACKLSGEPGQRYVHGLGEPLKRNTLTGDLSHDRVQEATFPRLHDVEASSFELSFR